MEFIDLRRQQELIRDSLTARMRDVLEHGRYVLGPEVQELEERLADYVGVAHCVTVSSGTDALLLALMALDIGPGDEVITTPFTFVATVEVIALRGARPVFVDIEADTYNLDATAVEAAITPVTRAIIAVDLYGQCADYAAIEAIARRHGLAVVEDAAQSFGATLHGRRAGSFGRIACTSFYPSKPLGAFGDGGACFTADEQLAASMRVLRNHGKDGQEFHSQPGLNARLDTLQAAILLAKLDIFDEEIRLRSEVAERYGRLLPESVKKPALRAGRTSAWAQYTIGHADRDGLRAALARQNIPTAVHYSDALHLSGPYRSGQRLPIAEAAARNVVSLPMHPYLSAAQQQRIAAAIAG